MPARTAPEQHLQLHDKQYLYSTPLSPPPIRVLSSHGGLSKRGSSLSGIGGENLSAKRSSSSVSSSILSAGDFSPSLSSSGTAQTSSTARSSSITTGTERESVLSIPNSTISSYRESWQSQRQSQQKLDISNVNNVNYLPLFSPDRPPSIPLPDLPSPRTLQHKRDVGDVFSDQQKMSYTYTAGTRDTEKRKRFSSLSDADSTSFIPAATTYIHTTTTTTSILPKRSSKRLQPSPLPSCNKNKTSASFDPSRPPKKPLPPSPPELSSTTRVASPPPTRIASPLSDRRSSSIISSSFGNRSSLRIASPSPQLQKAPQKLQKLHSTQLQPLQQQQKRSTERKGIPKPKLSLARLPKFGLGLNGGNNGNGGSKPHYRLSLRSFSSSTSTLAIPDKDKEHDQEDRVYDGSNVMGKNVIVPGSLQNAPRVIRPSQTSDRDVQSDPECLESSAILSSPVSPASPDSLNDNSNIRTLHLSSMSPSTYHVKTFVESPATYQPLTLPLSAITTSSMPNATIRRLKSSNFSTLEEEEDGNEGDKEEDEMDVDENEEEENDDHDDDHDHDVDGEGLSDSSASSADLNTLIMTPLPKRKIDPSLQAFAPSSDDDDDQDSEIDVEATLETIALKIGLEHAESSDDNLASSTKVVFKQQSPPRKKMSIKKPPTIRRKISMVYSSSDEEDFDRTLDRNKILSRSSTLSSGRYSLPHRASYSSLAVNSRPSSLSSRYVLGPGFQYKPSSIRHRDSSSTISSRTSYSKFQRTSSTSSLHDRGFWRSYSQPLSHRNMSAISTKSSPNMAASVSASGSSERRQEQESEREEILDDFGNQMDEHDDSGESDVFPTIQRHEAITAALASLSLQKSYSKGALRINSSNSTTTPIANANADNTTFATTPVTPCASTFTSSSASPSSIAPESPIPVFCRAQRVQIPSASGPTSTASAPVTPATYHRSSAVKKISHFQPRLSPSHSAFSLRSSTTPTSLPSYEQQLPSTHPHRQSSATSSVNYSTTITSSPSTPSTPSDPTLPLNIIKRSMSDEGLGIDGTLLSPTFIPRSSSLNISPPPHPPSSLPPSQPLPQIPLPMSHENRFPRTLSPPANIVTILNKHDHNNNNLIHNHNHHRVLSHRSLSPTSASSIPSPPYSLDNNVDRENNNDNNGAMVVVGRVRPLYIPTSRQASAIQ